MNRKRMRYSILLMAVCVFTFGIKVNAQSTFFNFVDGWRNNHSIELEDSYLLMGLDAVPNSATHFFQYNEIDYEGNVVNQYSYIVDSVETTSTYGQPQLAVRIDNSVYISSLLGFFSPSRSYGALFKFDLATQQIELLHLYDELQLTMLHCIEQKNDSSLLIGAYLSDNSSESRMLIYETDFQGEPRWSYSSDCGNYCRSYPEQILSLDNGNTVIMLREWDRDQPFFHDREKTVLVMLDPEGEEIWRAEPGDHENYKIIPGGVLEVDGNLLVSFTDPYYYAVNGEWLANYESSIFFERYDTSGNLLEEFDFEGLIPDGNSTEDPTLLYNVTQLQHLENDRILLSGYSGLEGFLLKMDSEGQIEWFRQFTPYPYPENNPAFYQYTHIHHVLKTSDGGFLCTGEYASASSDQHPNGIQTAFALKVDAYGCLEEGCEITSVEELSITLSSPIKVWPNPVTGNSFNITSQLDLHIASIELIDVQGRKISSAVAGVKLLDSGTITSLSPSHTIPSGLYTLLITTSEGVAYSLKLAFEE